MTGGEQPHDQQPTWDYRPENGAAPTVTDDSAAAETAPHAPDETQIEWTASEFIAHQKNVLWYFGLALVTLAVSGLLYLITRDLVTFSVIIVLGIIMGVAAANKPRLITYQLDRGGLRTDKRFYPYGTFKSFAIIDEGAFSSLLLLPLKRFNLPVNVYFSPEDQEEIVGVLSRHLPLQPGSLTEADRLMRKLRF